MSERIAYEELQPGTEVQPGDQYRNTQGRWVEYSMDTSGVPIVPIVGPTAMARRPYNITQMLQQRAELMRLNECLNHEVQTLWPLAEGLEQRCEKLETALETAHNAPDFAEGVAEVLRRLEIAADAMDYLAEVGTNNEVGYACGFQAAIAVVKKLQEEKT